METVNVRDLSNHGADVLNRVRAGHEVVVEQSGTPVARLVPLEQSRLDTAALVERRRSLPAVDVDQFRRDVDESIDSTL